MKTYVRNLFNSSIPFIAAQLILATLFILPTAGQSYLPKVLPKTQPLVVNSGSTAVTIETEPNNSLNEANVFFLSDSAEIRGLINNSGDMDFFRFEVNSTGEYLFRATSTILFSSVFPRIYLFDFLGNQQAFSEMTFPIAQLSQFAYRFSAPGTYYLAIDNFIGEGGQDSLAFGYQLNINPVVISDSLEMSRMFRFRQAAPFYNIEKNGDYLFSMELGETPVIRSWNVADPASPVRLGELDTPGLPNSMVFNNTVAYAALEQGANGIFVIDISDPSNLSSPTHITGFDARSTHIADSTLFVTDDTGGLRLYDISLPSTPVLQNRVQLPDSVIGSISMNDTHIFLGGLSNTSLIVLERQSLAIRAVVQLNDDAVELMLKDNVLFIAGFVSLAGYDISSPENPQLISTLPGQPENLIINGADLEGSNIYLAHLHGGIRRIDVSNPANPTETAFYYSLKDFTATDVVVEGNVIYAASGELFNVSGFDPRNGLHALQNDFVSSISSHGQPASVSDGFTLNSNYPNPFNPTTTISYSLQKSADVRLSIYNTLGQEVRVLVNEKQSSGERSVVWDGRDSQDIPVSSGIYLYTLRTENGVQSRRMILIK